MTYREFVKALAEDQNIDAVQAQKELRSVFDLLEMAVWEHGRLLIPGFGTFKRKTRAARKVTMTRADDGEQEVYFTKPYQVIAFKASKHQKTNLDVGAKE